MAKFTQSITINAPVEKVYKYLSDPANLPEWHPSVVRIRDITGRGENQKWTWDYKLWGHIFTEEVYVEKDQINTSRIFKSKGIIRSKRSFTFALVGEGTRLDYELEYTIPIVIINSVGEPLAIQRSKRVVDMALTNIKERMEG